MPPGDKGFLRLWRPKSELAPICPQHLAQDARIQYIELVPNLGFIRSTLALDGSFKHRYSRPLPGLVAALVLERKKD